MQLLNHSKLPFYCLALMVAVLATATILEYTLGSATVYRWIYSSWAFKIFWFLIATLSLIQIFRLKMWKRFFTFSIHLAFVFILTGALCTSLWGIQGTIHLRENIPTRHFLTDNKQIHQLPFSLTLKQFQTLYYPGTSSPRDYQSIVIAQQQTHQISMNKIVEIAHYRFYQSSFDEDQKGSLLSVNYDPLGISFTYFGYGLLLIAMLGFLCSPASSFRRLLKHPIFKQSKPIALFFLFFVSLQASASLPVIKREQADKLARLQVVYNNRICPLNTLATDFVKKLYGKASFHNLTPEQVLFSCYFYPYQWQEIPLIEVKNTSIRQFLGASQKHLTIAQFYQGKTYRLQKLLQQKPELAKAIYEIDEKIGLILMLRQGRLIQPLKEEQKQHQLSEQKIAIELLYNKIPFIQIGFIFNLLLGFIAFGLLIFKKNYARINTSLQLSLGLSFLLSACLFSLRWYLGGYIPLSNGFETMLFLSLCITGVGLLLMRRFTFILPFTALLTGFSLLVAHLSAMNPQITPLMPVLSSPLLCIHVTLVMFAYAIFALICLNSLYALWISRRERSHTFIELTLINRILLYPAVFLLAIGIFIGAVWANQSWGRYWGWDPKEVWALITLLIYSFALHSRSLPWFKASKNLHLFLALSFLTVLMTYFGVNYLLGGMHAYANS